jgi:hypothetical protein
MALGYSGNTSSLNYCDLVTLTLPDGRPAELIRRRTWRLLGRTRNWLQQKRWTSPEVRRAGQLLRLERLSEPGPRLLAFGQRHGRWGMVESFLLMQTAATSQSAEAECSCTV